MKNSNDVVGYDRSKAPTKGRKHQPEEVSELKFMYQEAMLSHYLQRLQHLMWKMA
jgi:hypothetical protein